MTTSRGSSLLIEGAKYVRTLACEERARLEAILEEWSARAHAGEEQLIDNEEAKRRLRLRSSR